MRYTHSRRAGLVAAAAACSLVGATLVTAGTASALPITSITLLNINDFHGRIEKDKTVQLAGTIEKERADAGEANTLLLSAGDNIGASLFESAYADDKPTIDVLNALDLSASAVGNHELDKGLTDLYGRVADAADFPYLAANIYLKGTATPVLNEYALRTVGGLTVGIIGAVTQETPALVTPSGIANLTFGDPVAAVNRVAGDLSDGNPANGEADIIVAEYHEGAGAGTVEGATLAQEVAAGGAFASIVAGTSAQVDVIFTGHTHKQYAWDAPVPGQSGKTRPIVQTGSYGENIGKVVLTVDGTDVTAAVASNVKRSTADPATLVATYPRVAEVKTLTDAAIAAAKTAGDVKVGSVTADITTAFAPNASGTPVRDDRASESTLGNLVADALQESLAATAAGADFGVVNPGGLRGELLYAPDGSITYSEANAVLPFVNNLWSTTLTGAQVKTMLEQQWQTNADGTVPSRPYLQLGLSKNVSYTYDAARAAGDRITSITINGKQVKATDEYRVGTFSFLATGGDNFRVFTSGKNTVDSGLVDRDAWVTYLKAHPGLAPSFARRAVAVSGNPSTAMVGSALSINVSKLDLTSLGSPKNTSLTATFTGGSLPPAGVALGTFPVTDGATTVKGAVPAAAAGATALTLEAAPSGTTVVLPLTGTAVSAVTVKGKLNKTRGSYGKPAKVSVTVTGATAAPSGKVEIREGSKVLVSKKLSVKGKVGTAKLTLPKLKVGSHKLTVYYPGSETTKAAKSSKLTYTVVKSVPSVKFRVSSHGRTVKVTTSATGVTPSGKVTVYRDGRALKTATLKKGKATVTVSKTSRGNHTYKVSYKGSSTVAARSATGRIRVS